MERSERLSVGDGGTAAISGKESTDGGDVAGLEGMPHSAQAWGLGDYEVIGVLWTEGAEEVLRAKK